jgi:hypothetical protein
MNRDVVRILVALLVLSAGISMGSGGVVTDHGNTTDTAPTSGQETRDAVFKGPPSAGGARTRSANRSTRRSTRRHRDVRQVHCFFRTGRHSPGGKLARTEAFRGQ